MNRFLDVMVVAVVFIFAILLVITVTRTCSKVKPQKKAVELESSVTMGKDGIETKSLSTDTTTEKWDEHIAHNDSAKLEADGITPEDMGSVDPDLASKLSEQGDDGIKKEKKETADIKDQPVENPDNSLLNKKPGGDTFLVIAGSFKDPANAKTMVSKLKELGYPAELVQFLNNNMKSVVVQRFSSRSKANVLVEELKTKHKVSTYIIKRREK